MTHPFKLYYGSHLSFERSIHFCLQAHSWSHAASSPWTQSERLWVSHYAWAGLTRIRTNAEEVFITDFFWYTPWWQKNEQQRGMYLQSSVNHKYESPLSSTFFADFQTFRCMDTAMMVVAKPCYILSAYKETSGWRPSLITDYGWHFNDLGFVQNRINIF